jgi:ATP-binding cassette, subfamily C (CFTR/MRP), member 1
MIVVHTHPPRSGKSSVIEAVLGRLRMRSGEVAVGGRVAYVAQSAWILNATLRDNILFGSPYDVKRYREVLHACELEHDIKVLPNHDMTEIGERGINLSGGQKQRVAIAR